MRILDLGRIDYADALQRMRAFNSARRDDTQDELWVLEHPRYLPGVSVADPFPGTIPWA
jgi:lipoate-protein ligase B